MITSAPANAGDLTCEKVESHSIALDHHPCRPAILHLTTHAGSGGDWVGLRKLCSSMAARGYPMTVGGASVNLYQLGDGVRGIDLPLNRGLPGLLSAWKTLRGLSIACDIVHTHTAVTALLGLL